MAGESKLQSKIIKALESEGWLVVKIKLCTKNGWPDLEAIKQGRTVRIECKDLNKKEEKLQTYRHEEIKAHGGEVYTIDTFEQFVKLNLC